MTSFELLFNEGFGALRFGASPAEAEQVFGPADETDVLDGPDGSTSLVWHYWEHGFSLFFERGTSDRFSCVELDEQLDSHLWGQPLFALKEKALKELFAANGFTEIDEETHTWGEKRISFEDVQIDFYFENGAMSSINFGVILSGEETKPISS